MGWHRIRLLEQGRDGGTAAAAAASSSSNSGGAASAAPIDGGSISQDGGGELPPALSWEGGGHSLLGQSHASLDQLEKELEGQQPDAGGAR